MSEVHYLDSRGRYSDGSFMARLGTVLDAAHLEELIEPGDWVVVKFEVGELGYLGYLRPPLIRAVTNKIQEVGGDPVIVDTTRLNAIGSQGNWDWLAHAAANGFTVPVLHHEPMLADGYTGQEFELLPVDGEELGGLEVARSVVENKALIVISHVTGHPFAGLSGALVNTGMGCSARRGKLRIHAPLKPILIPERCDGCGLCVDRCPKRVISLNEHLAEVNLELCVGCAYYCTAACPTGALVIEIEAARRFQKRIVEATSAVHMAALGKVHFFNFLFDVGPYPDYYPFSDTAIVPDLGLLSSRDPVAIDQATVDLIDQVPGVPRSMAEETDALAPGKGKLTRITGVDPDPMLEYAEQYGLGTRHYRLVPF